MTTSGMGRALRYFIWWAAVYVLWIAAGSFTLAVYIWLINGYDVSFRETLASVPSASLWICMVIFITSGISYIHYWYSMPVSFGCIRKNAFIGSLMMDLLVMGGTMVFYFLTSELFLTDMNAGEAVIILAVLFFIEGVGKLLGIAVMRWGKVAYVIVIIAIIALCICLGAVIGYVSVPAFLEEDMIQTVKWSTLLIGAAVCIAANTVNWRILRRFEVKV